MYHAIHKDSGRIVTLKHTDINDMFKDSEGRIVILSWDDEHYWLLADVDLIDEV